MNNKLQQYSDWIKDHWLLSTLAIVGTVAGLATDIPSVVKMITGEKLQSTDFSIQTVYEPANNDVPVSTTVESTNKDNLKEIICDWSVAPAGYIDLTPYGENGCSVRFIGTGKHLTDIQSAFIKPLTLSATVSYSDGEAIGIVNTPLSFSSQLSTVTKLSSNQLSTDKPIQASIRYFADEGKHKLAEHYTCKWNIPGQYNISIQPMSANNCELQISYKKINRQNTGYIWLPGIPQASLTGHIEKSGQMLSPVAIQLQNQLATK